MHIKEETMKFYIPNSIKEILNRLEKQGYEAYIVGGSVRDLVIGKEPKDYDITTSAKPEEIERIFKDKKTFDVGKHFGTIIVVTDDGNVEVTTYRTDGEYEDGRRPKQVYYTPHIIEDLSRRDFTINAMKLALEDGNVKTSEVEYINAHGTSTYFNDKLETLAVKNLFKDHANNINISSTKSMTGHLLGAAGGVEAIACALAIREGRIPLLLIMR